jgi:hypothetical protein
VTAQVVPGEKDASPHVTLRQAVRPVIVAQAVLARQQAAATALAAEVQELTELTRSLLRKLGQMHLLTAGARQAAGEPGGVGYADRLVEAYAEAGMAWAAVVGSAVKLADLLIDEHDWAAASLIADVLTECGEGQLGKHVKGQLNKAQDAYLQGQYASIAFSGAMSLGDIRNAIAVLKRLQACPKLESTFEATHRWWLAFSTQNVAQRHGDNAAQASASNLYNEARNGSYRPTNQLLPQIEAILSRCNG